MEEEGIMMRKRKIGDQPQQQALPEPCNAKQQQEFRRRHPEITADKISG